MVMSKMGGVRDTTGNGISVRKDSTEDGREVVGRIRHVGYMPKNLIHTSCSTEGRKEQKSHWLSVRLHVAGNMTRRIR